VRRPGSGWGKTEPQPEPAQPQCGRAGSGDDKRDGAAVESIRNILAGAVTIITARPAVSSKKIPAHSQVAPWKKRCRPG
jgi:hypothetical protein